MATGGSGDMEWSVARNRKRSASLPRDQRKAPRNSQTAVHINNKYAPLESLQSEEVNVATNANKNIKPPPIHITGKWPQGTASYSDLVQFLTLKGGENTFTLRSSSRGVTVFPNSPTSYRLFVKTLKECGCEYHTYQLPEDKMPYVVLRGLHHTTSEEIIKNEFFNNGYVVTKVTNVLGKDRYPLPLFFVEIDKNSFNDKIFDLTVLYHSEVKIEEPRKKKHLVQCGRCLRFSHTKAYCTLPFRCIKCGGDHDSKTCSKTHDTPATCANCNGAHPANYRGCTVYKELRNRRSPFIRRTEPTPGPSFPSPTDFPSLPKKTRHLDSSFIPTTPQVASTLNTGYPQPTPLSYSAVSQQRKRNIYRQPNLKNQEYGHSPSYVQPHLHHSTQESVNQFHAYHQEPQQNSQSIVCQPHQVPLGNHQHSTAPVLGMREQPYTENVPPQLTSILEGIYTLLQPLCNLLTQLSQITHRAGNTQHD